MPREGNWDDLQKHMVHAGIIETWGEDSLNFTGTSMHFRESVDTCNLKQAIIVPSPPFTFLQNLSTCVAVKN
jgi:hypothetical protein